MFDVFDWQLKIRLLHKEHENYSDWYLEFTQPLMNNKLVTYFVIFPQNTHMSDINIMSTLLLLLGSNEDDLKGQKCFA